MDDIVASVLTDAFPDRTVRTVGPAGPSWNANNRTVRVEFEDGASVYLKLARDGDPARLAREQAAIAYVGAHCDVFVPTISLVNLDGATPYLALEPLAGTSLADNWEESAVSARAAIAGQVGRTLATIHERRFEDHGRITGGDRTEVQVDPAPWPEMLLESIEYIRELAVSDRFDHHFDRVAAAVRANRDRLAAAPAVLVHGDVTRGNTFPSEDGIGLIDWEDAHIGDPVRELRRTQEQLLAQPGENSPTELVDALRAGYREQAGTLPTGFEDRQAIYGALSFLDTSGFFDEWAPDADRPTAALEDWVEREMERRLAAI